MEALPLLLARARQVYKMMFTSQTSAGVRALYISIGFVHISVVIMIEVLCASHDACMLDNGLTHTSA